MMDENWAEELFVDFEKPDEEEATFSEEHQEVASEEGLFRAVESTVIAILNCYLYDGDRHALERAFILLGKLLCAQPVEKVRPLLTRTSRRIDGLLPFADLWPGTSWQGLFAEDCWRGSVAPAGKRRIRPDREDETDSDFILSFDSRFNCDEGNADTLVVPFIAFILAGTGFPFTDEEAKTIRSGQGVSVADILEREREPERQRKREKICSGVVSAKDSKGRDQR